MHKQHLKTKAALVEIEMQFCATYLSVQYEQSWLAHFAFNVKHVRWQCSYAVFIIAVSCLRRI